MSLGKGPRISFAVALLTLTFAVPHAGHAACVITQSDYDKNGTQDLKLTGDNLRQNAVIELRGSGGYLAQIDCNGNGRYTDAVDQTRSGTDNIETYIVALGGTDTVTISQTEDLVGDMKNIVVTTIAGSNKFTYQALGHGIRQGSSLAFEIRGGAGGDIVTLDFLGATIENSLVVVRGDLAGGINQSNFVGAASTTGSLVDMDLALGDNNSVGALNDGGGVFSSSQLAAHVRGCAVVKGGDTLSTTFSGQIEDNSRVYLDANLRYGDDKYWGNFDISTFGIDTAGPAGSEAYFNVRGDNGFDLMKVSDLGAVGAATVNGLLAFDLESGNQADAIGIVWNGLQGSGQFRYSAQGESASDKLNLTFKTDATSTNDLWFYVAGGPEEDLSPFVFDSVNAIADDLGGTATYGALGALLLDGGLHGDDMCNASGTALHVAVNCEQGSR